MTASEVLIISSSPPESKMASVQSQSLPSATRMDSIPSLDDSEDLLLDCRYGDLDAVRSFVETFGIEALTNARDGGGNNVLHMCAANGHHDVLSFILSLPDIPPSLLASGNDAGNTPLHWACLNSQLECAKHLVSFKPTGNTSSKCTDASPAPGPALITACNNAGQTPLGGAESAGWDEGARWLVSVMDLRLASASSSAVETEEADVEGEAVDVTKNGKEKPGSQGQANSNDDVHSEMSRLRVSEEDYSRR